MMYNRKIGTNKQTVDKTEKSFVSLKHGSLCTAAPPPPPQKKSEKGPFSEGGGGCTQAKAWKTLMFY